MVPDTAAMPPTKSPSVATETPSTALWGNEPPNVVCVDSVVNLPYYKTDSGEYIYGWWSDRASTSMMAISVLVKAKTWHGKCIHSVHRNAVWM